MKTASKRRPRRANIIFPLGSLFLTLMGAGRNYGQENLSRPTVSLQYLERRKLQHEAAAQERRAFFGFHFTNRAVQSRIRVEHHIVAAADRSSQTAHSAEA